MNINDLVKFVKQPEGFEKDLVGQVGIIDYIEDENSVVVSIFDKNGEPLNSVICQPENLESVNDDSWASAKQFFLIHRMEEIKYAVRFENFMLPRIHDLAELYNLETEDIEDIFISMQEHADLFEEQDLAKNMN